MREMLFRGKDADTGVWREGQYIHLHKSTYCFKEDYDANTDNNIHQIVFERMMDWGLPNQHLRADVDPATVGQYTGLTDKNGKRIFEGDLLLIGDSQKPVLVEFINFSWECTSKSIGPYYRHRLEDNRQKYEVVGNIYDNPELLNET